MGVVESLHVSDVYNPKSGRFLIKGKNYNLKDVLDIYNSMVEKVAYFERKATDFLQERDNNYHEIERLRRELNQLKNVLSLKIDTQENDPNDQTSSSGNLNVPNISLSNSIKRFGVSGETTTNEKNLIKSKKSIESKRIISKALWDNDFLEHLDKSQVTAIIDCMQLVKVNGGQYVIREGDIGSGFYVIKEGFLEVIKGNKRLTPKPLTTGTLFGELAILYNCKRTASVRAITNVELYFIKREVYQTVMKLNMTERRMENLAFLASVPVLAKCDDLTLKKIVDVVDEIVYNDQEYIIREGEKGDAFFIIKDGNVDVLQMENDTIKKIRTLTKGDYFGEKALLKNDIRSASILAVGEVTCLSIEREIFLRIAGNLLEAMEKDYVKTVIRQSNYKIDSYFSKISLSNTLEFSKFSLISTLGRGAFGKVELVEYLDDKKRYALKRMDKAHIVKTKQQEHINNERDFLAQANCPFIIKLFQTYKDSKNVYLLMEACLGGDLFTMLHTVERFDSKSARFYVGCVIEALDYIHSRGFVYRDLKPENMILTHNGYIKMVDFGFTKRVSGGEKTFTFCGTPEYVAPEVILSKGHDKSADYWSLGILVFELINGSPPFTSNDSMTTYRLILKGIDSVSFPKKLSKYATNLVKALCKDNPAERLGNQKEGIEAIRKHRWFEGFHWSGLQNRTLSPPLIPKIKKHQLSTDSSVLSFVHGTEDMGIGWDELF